MPCETSKDPSPSVRLIALAFAGLQTQKRGLRFSLVLFITIIWPDFKFALVSTPVKGLGIAIMPQKEPCLKKRRNEPYRYHWLRRFDFFSWFTSIYIGHWSFDFSRCVGKRVCFLSFFFFFSLFSRFNKWSWFLPLFVFSSTQKKGYDWLFHFQVVVPLEIYMDPLKSSCGCVPFSNVTRTCRRRKCLRCKVKELVMIKSWGNGTLPPSQRDEKIPDVTQCCIAAEENEIFLDTKDDVIERGRFENLLDIEIRQLAFHKRAYKRGSILSWPPWPLWYLVVSIKVNVTVAVNATLFLFSLPEFQLD